MSTALADVIAPARNRSQTYFLFRRLHSLTGVLFGGYVLVHLLVNATLVEGARHDGQPTVYQKQVDSIHALPFLDVIAWGLLLLPLIYHTVYGIWITITGMPNTASYPYKKNILYMLQRVSAVVLVLFITFHYLSMKGAFGGELGARLTFVPVNVPDTAYSEATQSTVNHLHGAWWVGYVVYPIGILAATFHLANGFWTAGITWGLTITKRAQQRWGMLCTGLFVFATTCGFVALIAALRAPPVRMDSQYRQENRVGEKKPDNEHSATRNMTFRDLA